MESADAICAPVLHPCTAWGRSGRAAPVAPTPPRRIVIGSRACPRARVAPMTEPPSHDEDHPRAAADRRAAAGPRPRPRGGRRRVPRRDAHAVDNPLVERIIRPSDRGTGRGRVSARRMRSTRHEVNWSDSHLLVSSAGGAAVARAQSLVLQDDEALCRTRTGALPYHGSRLAHQTSRFAGSSRMRALARASAVCGTLAAPCSAGVPWKGGWRSTKRSTALSDARGGVGPWRATHRPSAWRVPSTDGPERVAHTTQRRWPSATDATVQRRAVC